MVDDLVRRPLLAYYQARAQLKIYTVAAREPNVPMCYEHLNLLGFKILRAYMIRVNDRRSNCQVNMKFADPRKQTQTLQLGNRPFFSHGRRPRTPYDITLFSSFVVSLP